MGLGESRYNLWVVLEDDKRIRASVITSIETYPSGKQAFSILMVAGDAKDEWMHFLDVLEAKGKGFGLSIHGDDGASGMETAPEKAWLCGSGNVVCERPE